MIEQRGLEEWSNLSILPSLSMGFDGWVSNYGSPKVFAFPLTRGYPILERQTPLITNGGDYIIYCPNWVISKSERRNYKYSFQDERIPEVSQTDGDMATKLKMLWERKGHMMCELPWPAMSTKAEKKKKRKGHKSHLILFFWKSRNPEFLLLVFKRMIVLLTPPGCAQIK